MLGPFSESRAIFFFCFLRPAVAEEQIRQMLAQGEIVRREISRLAQSRQRCIETRHSDLSSKPIARGMLRSSRHERQAWLASHLVEGLVDDDVDVVAEA